jgi:hypothetical protein
VYHASILARLTETIGLRRYGMEDMLENLRVTHLPLRADEVKLVSNWNRPEDVDGGTIE